MRIKNSEVIAKTVALAEIIKRGEKYPGKFAFALSKNMRLLESLNKDIEVSRNKLLDEYNVKNEEGKPAYLTSGKIEIAEEHRDKWEKEMNELLDIEVEFTPQLISTDVLDNTNIETEILYICDFMFE